MHPLESRMSQSASRTFRILLLVWLLPALVALPNLYPCEAAANQLTSRLGTIHRLTCFANFSPHFRRVYFTTLFLLFYLGPLVFIGWTCSRIAMRLLSGTVLHRQGVLRRQEINRRKASSAHRFRSRLEPHRTPASASFFIICTISHVFPRSVRTQLPSAPIPSLHAQSFPCAEAGHAGHAEACSKKMAAFTGDVQSL